MTARMPKKYIEHNTLAELPIGSSGWTVPWAMMVTTDREYYLCGSYTYHREPGGTVTM